MDPRLRTAIATVLSVGLAIFLGIQLAQGSYLWPSVAGAVVLGAILIRFTGLPADTILLGLVVIGYIVGNRGFAQLTPTPGLPLLPAELALLVGCSWRLIQGAFLREVPFQRDALNWAVLAWLAVGTLRVGFDVPRYGMLALRDYAQVYYAVFFFLAQHMARDSAGRRFLVGCLLFAAVALVPVYALFQLFPDFFLTQLTVAGTPLVYFKGDLAVTFLSLGAMLVFNLARGGLRFWAWPLVLAMLLLVFTGGNRAAMLGLVLAAGLMLVAGRWRWSAFLGAVASSALAGLLVLALVFSHTWSERRLQSLSDQAMSVADFSGTARYESSDSSNKGDNNRFRLVWWRNVIEETWSTSPVFGLGFGADLAHGFLQEYYADSSEEFTTRSPHNVFLTVFGRMGIVGLAVWTTVCGLLLGATWRALRLAEDPVQWCLWCGACAILVSASLGVVLEGPMGAVIFWTILGLANAGAAPATAGAKPTGDRLSPPAAPDPT